MSRSNRKPYYILTNQIDKSKAHKQVRRRIKMELQKPGPDLTIIEADTKELGFEELGTKFGYEFLANLSEKEREEYLEDAKKAGRK